MNEPSCIVHVPNSKCFHEYKNEVVWFHGFNKEGFCIVETKDGIVHVAAYDCYFNSLVNRNPNIHRSM